MMIQKYLSRVAVIATAFLWFSQAAPVSVQIQAAEQNPAGGGPVHRYSFDDAGSTTLLDSIGTADGELKGNNGSQAAGRLNLGGGMQTSAAYGDLPNGIISTLTDATFEFWVTTDNNRPWSRIFDFGSNTAGEQTGPGGVGSGVNYIMLSANKAWSATQRLEFAVGASIQNADSINTTEYGVETHIVVTFDDAADELNYYKNSELISTVSTANQLSQIDDVNNWLGRSNWADKNMEGSYDEVRIYDRALTPNQIIGNFEAGPNDLNVVPEPTSATLLILGILTLGGVRRRRRA